MSTRTRRLLGVLCLAASVGMLVIDELLLKGTLSGVLFLIYWLICLGFTVAAVVFALMDARAVRAASREHQRELIEHTLREIEENKERD